VGEGEGGAGGTKRRVARVCCGFWVVKPKLVQKGAEVAGTGRGGRWACVCVVPQAVCEFAYRFETGNFNLDEL
jgi:hypothetical protein